ncbi:MAG: hypothetical protein D6805_00165, partial [Planctomycetota bacterium]
KIVSILKKQSPQTWHALLARWQEIWKQTLTLPSLFPPLRHALLHLLTQFALSHFPHLLPHALEKISPKFVLPVFQRLNSHQQTKLLRQLLPDQPAAAFQVALHTTTPALLPLLPQLRQLANSPDSPPPLQALLWLSQLSPAPPSSFPLPPPPYKAIPFVSEALLHPLGAQLKKRYILPHSLLTQLFQQLYTQRKYLEGEELLRLQQSCILSARLSTPQRNLHLLQLYTALANSSTPSPSAWKLPQRQLAHCILKHCSLSQEQWLKFFEDSQPFLASWLQPSSFHRFTCPDLQAGLLQAAAKHLDLETFEESYRKLLNSVHPSLLLYFWKKNILPHLPPQRKKFLFLFEKFPRLFGEIARQLHQTQQTLQKLENDHRQRYHKQLTAHADQILAHVKKLHSTCQNTSPFLALQCKLLEDKLLQLQLPLLSTPPPPPPFSSPDPLLNYLKKIPASLPSFTQAMQHQTPSLLESLLFQHPLTLSSCGPLALFCALKQWWKISLSSPENALSTFLHTAQKYWLPHPYLQEGAFRFLHHLLVTHPQRRNQLIPDQFRTDFAHWLWKELHHLHQKLLRWHANPPQPLQEALQNLATSIAPILERMEEHAYPYEDFRRQLHHLHLANAEPQLAHLKTQVHPKFHKILPPLPSKLYKIRTRGLILQFADTKIPIQPALLEPLEIKTEEKFPKNP